MMKNRGILLLVVVFLLSACAHYTLVEPAQRDMGGGYSVEPQIAWNRSVQGKIEIWTIDGPALAAVHFFNTLRPSIFSTASVTDKICFPFTESQRAKQNCPSLIKI
jgi:hypothetical protein